MEPKTLCKEKYKILGVTVVIRSHFSLISLGFHAMQAKNWKSLQVEADLVDPSVVKDNSCVGLWKSQEFSWAVKNVW